MDLDTIKLLVAITCAVVSLIVVLAKKSPVLFHGSSVAVFIGLVLITLHYYFIGFAITETTNQTILFAAFLWLATFLAISAFGPENSLRATFGFLSWILYPATAYLTYLMLTEAGIGSGSYFVGFTENPNIMGGYLALFMFPIVLQHLLDRSERGFLVVLDSITLAAILYMIYLTGSRGASLAVGLSLVYISLVSKGIRPAFKIIMIGAFLLAAVLMQEFFLKYESLGSFNTREFLIILRLEAIAERPWFGWGLAADVNNSFNHTNIFPPQEKGNTFLQFIEEFGLVLGFPLFVLIVGLCVAISFRLKKYSDKTWLIAFIIIALTHSMVETWMLNFRSFFAISFWVLVLIGGAYASSLKAAASLRSAGLAGPAAQRRYETSGQGARRRG